MLLLSPRINEKIEAEEAKISEVVKMNLMRQLTSRYEMMKLQI